MPMSHSARSAQAGAPALPMLHVAPGFKVSPGAVRAVPALFGQHRGVLCGAAEEGGGRIAGGVGAYLCYRLPSFVGPIKETQDP